MGIVSRLGKLLPSLFAQPILRAMPPEAIESAATVIKSSSNPPPEIRNDERRRVTAALPDPTIPVAASRVRPEYICDPPTVLLRAAGFP